MVRHLVSIIFLLLVIIVPSTSRAESGNPLVSVKAKVCWKPTVPLSPEAQRRSRYCAKTILYCKQHSQKKGKLDFACLNIYNDCEKVEEAQLTTGDEECGERTLTKSTSTMRLLTCQRKIPFFILIARKKLQSPYPNTKITRVMNVKCVKRPQVFENAAILPF